MIQYQILWINIISSVWKQLGVLENYYWDLGGEIVNTSSWCPQGRRVSCGCHFCDKYWIIGPRCSTDLYLQNNKKHSSIKIFMLVAKTFLLPPSPFPEFQINMTILYFKRFRVKLYSKSIRKKKKKDMVWVNLSKAI